MLRGSRHRIASATALVLVLALPALAVAHSLRATDTAHLRYLSASGSLLHERGNARGTLPGQMVADMRIGPRFNGSFVIYARGGSIRGRGDAIPKGEGVYESFSGSLKVTGGSGRYRHAHGTARMYGTFNRNTYAFVVQTVGTLLY
jgi:hypothetical protein